MFPALKSLLGKTEIKKIKSASVVCSDWKMWIFVVFQLNVLLVKTLCLLFHFKTDLVDFSFSVYISKYLH